MAFFVDLELTYQLCKLADIFKAIYPLNLH